MNVLVTGCAGYIGSRLCGHLLDGGHRVLGVDSLRYRQGPALFGLVGRPGFTFERGDVRQTEWLAARSASADAVVHLAAVVGTPACAQCPDEAQAVNRDATLALAAMTGRTKRLVYANTNSGYGKCQGLAVETTPMLPLSGYACDKCAGEAAVLDAHGISLRLATVFGPSPRMRFDLLVNDFTRQLVALHHTGKGTLRLYEPHFRRSAVHVDDACRAFVLAVEGGLVPGTYNVAAPDGNRTKLELAHAICAALGVPAGLVEEGEGSDPDGRDYAVSSAKLVRQGFAFKKTLDEGVREVAQLLRLVSPLHAQSMNNLL
jgi:nucleoside-diphosphate-sugar epimerase